MRTRPWMSPDEQLYASMILSVLRMMPAEIRLEVLRDTFAELGGQGDDEAARDLWDVIRAEEINRRVDWSSSALRPRLLEPNGAGVISL